VSQPNPFLWRVLGPHIIEHPLKQLNIKRCPKMIFL
jgi:hypothetical protein